MSKKEIKEITVGDLKKILKSLGDDMPLYICTQGMDKNSNFHMVTRVSRGSNYVRFECAVDPDEFTLDLKEYEI